MIAIFQAGHAIFGIGETIETAKQNAKEWLDRDTDLDAIERYIPGRAVDGGLYYAPCSKELAATVEQAGGDIRFEIVDGELELPMPDEY